MATCIKCGAPPAGGNGGGNKGLVIGLVIGVVALLAVVAVLGIKLLSGGGSTQAETSDTAKTTDIAETEETTAGPAETSTEEATDGPAETSTEATTDEADGSATGDTEDVETQTDSDRNLAESLYDEVLAETYEYIVNGNEDEREYKYLSLGLAEAVNGMSQGEPLQTIGYCITDISGDFIPELLIGRIPGKGGSATEADLYSCFSVRDGELVTVFEAWYRNRVRWLSENRFFHNGSSGAARSVYGVLRFEGEETDDFLSGHEIENVWEDYYFTQENGTGGISSYHNRTGDEDPGESEVLDDDQGRFWEIYASYEEQCRPLPLKPVGSRRNEQAILDGTVTKTEPVTGYWSALSHVNRVITGYYFHPDGTWTAEANYYGYLYPHEFSERIAPAAFFGTWEAAGTGGDGVSGYRMYDAEGSELGEIQVLPPTGEEGVPGGETPALVFPDGDTYY